MKELGYKLNDFDDGKIVQSGKHDELMNQDGIDKRFVLDRKDAVRWKI